jgi:hypothetical protein
MRFPRGSFGATTEARMSDDYERARTMIEEARRDDDYERARTMIEEARRDDALGRATRASIERQVAGGAEAAGHVHLEKGDTLWSFANRVLDAAQEEETEDRAP